MGTFDFQKLRERINETCVLLFNDTPWCTLCFAQLPFQSQYDSHMNGKNHRRNSYEIYCKLMREFISPGIVLFDDKIYCFLCDEDVGNRFDWMFRNHLSSASHQNRVDKLELEFDDLDLEEYFPDDRYDALFIKGITHASIYFNDADGECHCWLCNACLPGESQFCSHTKGSSHLDQVIGQLTKLVEKVGLSLGILIEDESFVCKLCQTVLGEEMDVDRVYEHLVSYNHKAKVQKQIDDGLFEYYDDYDSCDFNSCTSGDSEKYSCYSY